MPIHFFCPNCFAEIEERIVHCPCCGYATAEYDYLPHKEKLIINALRHPIRENRMMAIQLLGDLKCRAAIPAFISILDSESDFYVVREVIRSLEKNDDDESRTVMNRLKSHQSKLVRDLVL